VSQIPVVYTAPEKLEASPRVSLGKKVLFASLIAFVGAVLIEVVARALVPEPLEWREHPAKILEFDATRAWRLRPLAVDFTVDKPVRVNAAGFRDREFATTREPGVARVACVGDSYTYGWGVELEESYPKQLERRLSSKSTAEVLNFGVFGYNADQVLETLRSQVAPYAPDLVLYGFYWDDLLPVRAELMRRETFESRLESEGQGASLFRRTLRHSRALFFAVDRARAIEASMSPPRTRFFQCYRAILAGEDDTIRDLWDGEARAICDMRDECTRRGSRFAVVLWPLEAQVLSDQQACHFQDRAQRICDAAGVPLISMLEPLRSIAREGKAPYLPFEKHPTPEGYRRCSEKIAGEIEKLGLLPSKK
jgi:lysophospholipase L1-like esterase